MSKLEEQRKSWKGKSDEWLFERLSNELTDKVDTIHNLLEENERLKLPTSIWRCNQSIQDLCGNTIFTKGLLYEQIDKDNSPLMLLDNKLEASEVSNLKDHFSPINE